MITREADDLRGIRTELLQHLGRDTIMAIHKQSRTWDLLAVAMSILAFAGLIAAIAVLPFGPLWLACIVLQGMVLVIIGLVNHDLFVHRKIFGDRGSWIASVLVTLPLPFHPTGYAQAHLAHHRSIGSERDTEAYKQDLNTRLRRLAFCTLIGVKRVTAGAWATPKRPPYLSLRMDHAELNRRVAVEKRLQAAISLLLLAAAWMWPRALIFGYFVPSLVIVPVLNTLRILIEHADLNPDNPYHIATFYRTGWFTRLIYLWDSGDCHLIHHIYPNIPYYRIGKALKVMRPFLLERGVVERHSYAALIWGWIVKNYPHRSLWPLASSISSRR